MLKWLLEEKLSWLPCDPSKLHLNSLNKALDFHYIIVKVIKNYHFNVPLFLADQIVSESSILYQTFTSICEYPNNAWCHHKLNIDQLEIKTLGPSYFHTSKS